VVIATTSALTAGVFSHIAVTRSGSTFTLWMDGVSQGTYSNAASHAGGLFNVLIGGTLGTANMLRGYMDEIRFTAGVARYTSNFVPPNAPFPDYG
jgi:hypothetical protein